MGLDVDIRHAKVSTVADGGDPNLVQPEDWNAAHSGAFRPRWDDVRIEPVARTTGVNAPSFEKWMDDTPGTSRGVYLYSFDKAATNNQKEIFFSLQMPHDWNGGEVHLHIHWVGDTSRTAEAPRWGLEYSMAGIGQVYADTVFDYVNNNEQADANVTALRHYISEFAAIVPTSAQGGISAILAGRIFRQSGNAGDTYTGKCGLLYIDAHYVRDSLGSVSEYNKAT